MAKDELSDLRSRFAGCELVALLDIAARTVLACDSAVPLGQENLDTLCEMAVAIFPPETGEGIRSACIARPTGVRVLVRLSETSEVVCGVFSTTADINGFDDAVRRLFDLSESRLSHV